MFSETTVLRQAADRLGLPQPSVVLNLSVNVTLEVCAPSDNKAVEHQLATTANCSPSHAPHHPRRIRLAHGRKLSFHQSTTAVTLH